MNNINISLNDIEDFYCSLCGEVMEKSFGTDNIQYGDKYFFDSSTGNPRFVSYKCKLYKDSSFFSLGNRHGDNWGEVNDLLKKEKRLNN